MEREPFYRLAIETIQETPCPKLLDQRLLEEWADGIPVYSENDPERPEWRETPTIEVDLSRRGYGKILLKNEGDRSCNPTGTVKDRAAWEIVCLYRNFARNLYFKRRSGELLSWEIKKMPVPRFTQITSGNAGRSLETFFRAYRLPPPKLLFDHHGNVPLDDWYADIYVTDLSGRALTPEEILTLTNNDHGVDITSFCPLQPELVFYDWHVHEAFNQDPDYIFVPYGSGRLMENYLAWQYLTATKGSSGKKDPRLRINTSRVISMNVIGSETHNPTTAADKLLAPHNPFQLFRDTDIQGLRNLSFSGDQTDKYEISEEYLQKAHSLLREIGMAAEPSGAAGLAMYMEMFDQRKIQEDKKVLVVNTGQG